MFSQHLLPASVKRTQRLWFIVRLPDTGIILVEGVPVLKPPAHYASVEGAGMQDKGVDKRLLPLPELGWAVFAEGIGETVGSNYMMPIRGVRSKQGASDSSRFVLVPIT